mmetsp:Transcript_30509/g.107212  ORF Transcript_30509/g.107212 Transcript_30509/m.107212 type:complete len:205 (+) Transcript_30509:1098-1712(+)
MFRRAFGPEFRRHLGLPVLHGDAAAGDVLCDGRRRRHVLAALVRFGGHHKALPKGARRLAAARVDRDALRWRGRRRRILEVHDEHRLLQRPPGSVVRSGRPGEPLRLCHRSRDTARGASPRPLLLPRQRPALGPPSPKRRAFTSRKMGRGQEATVTSSRSCDRPLYTQSRTACSVPPRDSKRRPIDATSPFSAIAKEMGSERSK